MENNIKTLKEFAAHIGNRPSYITKLKNTGRLVLTEDGKVLVNESVKLIKETAGHRSDVATRHEITRKKNKNSPEILEEEKTLTAAARVKALAESRRVAALADKEELERDKLAGDLIARDDVEASMKFVGATIRGLLDVFPDQVAPVVSAVSDVNECHAHLSDACRDILVRFGDAIKRQMAVLEGDHGA